MAVAACRRRCASTNRASEYCVSRLRPFLLWYGLALVFTSPKTHIGGRRHYCSGYAAAGGDLTSVWAILCALAKIFDNVCVMKNEINKALSPGWGAKMTNKCLSASALAGVPWSRVSLYWKSPRTSLYCPDTAGVPWSQSPLKTGTTVQNAVYVLWNWGEVPSSELDCLEEFGTGVGIGVELPLSDLE